jgi:flavin reductase (DIM6/NTAB) family NADH-FMN oxidoreductase RutF
MQKIKVNYEKLNYGFPIVLASYYDEKGMPNITTISSTISLRDMLCLGFGRNDYALDQIKKIKDFVINVPDRNFMKEIDFCGHTSGAEYNKFDLTGLTPVKSDNVNAPHIKEMPISIECTFKDTIEKDYFEKYTLVLAKIKGRYISSDLLDSDAQLLYSGLDPVLYVGNGNRGAYRYSEKNLMHRLRSFL